MKKTLVCYFILIYSPLRRFKLYFYGKYLGVIFFWCHWWHRFILDERMMNEGLK